MPSYAPIDTTNDGAAVGSNGLTAPTLWGKMLESYEKNTDFYAPVEGSSANSIIMTTTALSEGSGQKLKIRVESELGDEPHYGDDVFDDVDDFETLKFGEYELQVDQIRHAVSHTKRMEEQAGLRGEIASGLPGKLGRWLGRRKTEDADMAFKFQTPDANQFYPNSKAISALGAADTLDWDYIMDVATSMQNQGGAYGRLGTFNGSPAMGFALVTPSDAAVSLRKSAKYLQVTREAGARGAGNYLFKGDYPLIDGVQIVDRRVIDMDYVGPIGSAMNPKALLGTAITAGTAVFDITGGGNATNGAITKKMYFRNFDGYAYKFATGLSLSPASATRYLLIRNPMNAATDPGKFGMYSYTTGNNGNKITIVNRLGSAAGTARVTTLGSVTWDSGVWAGKHTDVHPEGAEIYPCNAKGEPLGCSFLLGKGAMLRGYGLNKGKRIQELSDMGNTYKIGIEAWFGQKIRLDVLDRAPGVAVMHHAIHYSNIGLPTVV